MSIFKIFLGAWVVAGITGAPFGFAAEKQSFLEQQMRISDGYDPLVVAPAEGAPGTLNPELARELALSDGSPVLDLDVFLQAERTAQMAGKAPPEGAAPGEAFPRGFSVSDGNPAEI